MVVNIPQGVLCEWVLFLLVFGEEFGNLCWVSAYVSECLVGYSVDVLVGLQREPSVTALVVSVFFNRVGSPYDWVFGLGALYDFLVNSLAFSEGSSSHLDGRPFA